jgi:dTDP-3-amino-3,4,6-trideoxy-alpha-D-glucose transaminase
VPPAKHVTFADVHWTYTELRAELDQSYHRVMDSGWYILSDEVTQFEQEFADYCGARHCVAVGNGLDALSIALRALGIGPGDEVIVPANTYIATWLAVSAVGARPVPVDADETTSNIDPALIPAALTPATRAVFPVHLYGQPADMRGIAEATGDPRLPIIEDAAQAHGATAWGGRAGALGTVAGFSFYPTKNLGAFGDAGALVTDSEQIAEFARLFRNYGSPRKYENLLPGANSRLDPLQAAFLRVKLAHLDAWNARRQEIAERYLAEIRECGGLLSLPRVIAGCEAVWHVFCVRSQLRDALAASLAERGIETLIHYPTPPYASAAYAPEGPWPAMPVSDRLAAQSLSLPMGPHLDDDEVALVIDAVNAFTDRHEAAAAPDRTSRTPAGHAR